MTALAVVLGQGRYRDEVAESLAAGGSRQEFVEIARKLGGDILSFTSAAAVRGGWYRRLFAKRPIVGSILAFLPQRNRYRVIYTTGEDVAFPLAMALKLLGWNGRIISRIHNMSPRKHRLLKAIGPGIFAALVTSSRRQATELLEVAGFPPDKVHSVSKWVDDRLYVPADAPVANQPPRVIACGAENRDYALLQRVAPAVDARFEVYGHGFFGENAARLARGADTPANVVFQPRVSAIELARAYREADVVMLPLNDVNYSAGVTGMMEGMAAGRPVVVTATPGLAEYLVALPAECIVPPGDDAAMAQALRALLADRAKRDRLGAEHRAWIEANASLDGYVAFVAAQVRQVLDRG